VLTYELTVTNRRASDAADVQVLMPVPSGMASTSGCQAVSDGATFPTNCVAARDVTWSLGALGMGASRTVHVSFLTTGNDSVLPEGTIVPGTARARDAAGGAARAGVSTAVQTTAPLMLDVTELADPVAAGDSLEYTLTFGNRAVGSQLAAQLRVTLPPGLSPLETNGGTVAGDTVTWALGDLGGGQVGERRLRVQVGDLATADPLTRLLRAVVTSGTAAARASVVTTLGARPLGLVMVATPAPVGRALGLTYELTVTNRRASDAADVQVLVPVPSGMAGTSGCLAASDGATFPTNCVAGRDVAWSLGALGMGASRTVHVTFLTSGSATTLPEGTIVPGTARARDAAGGSARAGVSTAVQATAPLMLDIAENADPVAAGDTLDYTLTFGNRTAVAQAASTLALTIPLGVTPVDTNGGTVNGDTVTWALGDLGGGQVGERRLRVQVGDLAAADPRTRLVRAVVTSGTAAARASVVTTLGARPLGLVMMATPDPVGRAEALTYTLKVTNLRAGNAVDVQLLVPVPSGMAGTSGCQAVSDGGVFPTNCVAGRDVTWNLGQILPQADRTVQVTFLTTGNGTVIPDGTIVSGTARVRDAAGGSARAAAAVAVDEP
jgi:hypothetical protein